MRGMYFTIGLLCAACPILCQTSISGTVRDVRNKPLPAAEVQVQSESTGARWKSQSENDGSYCVTGLPADHYKVTVRLAGFRTVSHSDVERSEERRVGKEC